MTIRAAIIAGPIAFAIFTLGTAEVASASVPEPPANEIIPLYASGSRALAMLTLGDGPPAPVVFDTGEDRGWIVKSYASHLGLKPIGTMEMPDEATGKTSIVPLVRFVAPKLSGVDVQLKQGGAVDYSEPDMVGVFGPGAFTGRLVTLELARNQVRVSPLTPDALPPGKASPYFHNLPAMTIDVAGIPALAHLDSGQNGALALGKGLMTKVKLKASPTIVGQAQSVSGVQAIYGGQIDGDVKIGPLILHDPQVTFMGAGDGANVGYEIMRQLIVVMDPAGRRSWMLDPADLKGSLDQFAGVFGVRTVRAVADKLIYQREGRPEFELHYLGGDLFEIRETGDRVQFHRKNGRVSAFDLIDPAGSIARADRSS